MVVKFIFTTETQAVKICEFLNRYYDCEYHIKLSKVEDTGIHIALCSIEFGNVANRSTIENVIKEHNGLIVQGF